MDTKASKCWIDPDECINCGLCEPECPKDAIWWCDHCEEDTYLIDQKKCDCCVHYDGPLCEEVCPLEGVIDCSQCQS